jgi:rod shape-determining protein MreD
VNYDLLKRFGAFIILCLVQGMILNQIHLFGVATPLLFIYFVITFHRNYPKWGILLWSFALGVCVDTFSNTPGVGSASLTLVGALQPYLLEMFTPRDSAEDMAPTMKTMGLAKYIYFASICTLIETVSFFALEAFSFFNWQQWLICVGSSFVLTLILVLTIENLINKRQ